MYAKQTQTDAVCVKDKMSDDEGEEESTETSRDLQAAGAKGGHKDDTIEPEKQVHQSGVCWNALGHWARHGTLCSVPVVS